MPREPEIHKVVRKNDVKRLEELLTTNHDINCLDREGQTPLYLALHVRSQESAILLLKHGAKYFKRNRSREANILHEAAELGTALVVKWLLENGSSAEETNDCKWTPLHMAATEAVARILLELGGADVNAKSKCGTQPIHRAVNVNHHDVVKTLLDHGADVNATDDNGYTPLHHLDYDPEMVKLLLNNGADVNAKTKDGENVLHLMGINNWLIDAEMMSTFEEILKHDIDIDAQDDRGETPLHGVMHYPAVVRIFLRRGANINVRDEFFQTPLDGVLYEYSRINGSSEDIGCTMDYLIQHGTKLKALDIHMEEPLHYEIELTSEDITNEDCEREINMLKAIGCTSLKDILTTRYPRYVLNKDFCDKLAMIDVAKYPIYGELILDKLRQDQKRMVKLEQCLSLFARSKLEPTLPVNIWERILSNLKDAELTGILRKQNKRKTETCGSPPSAKNQRIV